MIAGDSYYRHSSALNPSSATSTSSSHFPLVQAEPEQNDSSPTRQRRPSGLSTRSAFPFSANSTSNNILLGQSKAPSFSTTASKFRYLSRYRSRRSSEESLTDLSPPTHPDLDSTSQPWVSSALCTDEPLKSTSSFTPSNQSSVIFLGRSSRRPSLTRQPSKNKTSIGCMAHTKADVNHPSSFSLRLRLLSIKSTAESQCSESDKSFIPKYRSEHSSSHSLKPSVLKSLHNKVSKTDAMGQLTPDSDEFESIRSPTNNSFGTLTNPNSSQRISSIFNISQTSRRPLARELGRSSSSPNLNFTGTTFSQRPSHDSVRTQATVDSFEKPKRSHAPPPIKVPLRAASIAIAIGSDSSSAGHSRIPRPHFNSSSESIAQSVRRFAGVRLSTSASKQSHCKANVNPTNETLLQPKSRDDGCEDLSTIASSPRIVHVPYSLAVNRDKFPVVMPLQPAPRRLPGHSLSASNDSKGQTLPLLISNNSRSLVNPTSPIQQRTGSRITSEGTCFNTTPPRGEVVDNNHRHSKPLTSNARVSRCLQSPKFASQTPNRESSPSPNGVTDQHEQHSRALRSPSPSLIPFPTSEQSVHNSAIPDPITPLSTHYTSALEKKVNPSIHWTGTSDGDHIASVTSFDIRSFPLRLETSFESSESLPSITTPESVKIPQILSVTESPPAVTAVSAIPSATTKKLPFESNDFSPIRTSVSDISTNAQRSANFTSMSISPSNFSGSVISRTTSKSITSASHFSAKGKSFGLSVDDFYVNINSNVLMDFSRRKVKKMYRPRSVSDCDPNEIWMGLFDGSKDLASSQSSSPFSAGYPPTMLPRMHSPNSNAIITQSIDQQIRGSTPSELNKIVQDALKAHNSDAHRFIVGDVIQLIQEAKRVEENTKELHLRYLNAVRKRENLFEKNIITQDGFKPRSGSRLGESLSKHLAQVDQLATKLLDSINYSSRIRMMCDAHWRAAAVVQLNNLAVKEAHLEAAQCRIEQLESERCRHVKEISDLQCKLDLLQYQVRPSSRSTDADSIGSGSIPSTNAPLGPVSPSSTPRINIFPFNGVQRHGKIVHSRMRLGSAHSFSSAFNSHSLLDVSSNDGVCTTSSVEPVSRRPAFLPSYGLAHSRALSLEQSETLSQNVYKNELRIVSPPKTDKLSSSSITAPSAPLNTLVNFNRSESIGPARNTKPAALAHRPFFPNNNVTKPKGPIKSLHLKGDRTSSFGSSDARIVVPDSTSGLSLAPWEVKPRSSSSALQASQSTAWTQQNAGTGFISEMSSIAASSSLSRFPRQAPPPPKLPLPSEKALHRRDDWSPDASANGNLSSINLSQLGSMDIANLINNLYSSEQKTI